MGRRVTCRIPIFIKNIRVVISKVNYGDISGQDLLHDLICNHSGSGNFIRSHDPKLKARQCLNENMFFEFVSSSPCIAFLGTNWSN